MKAFFCFVLVFVAAVLMSGNASATLFDGQTVNYQYYFPVLSNPYPSADNGNKVVGPGIEVNNIADDLGTLDISDTNLLISFNNYSSWVPATFNGFEITDILATIPDFTSVLINPATNMAGFDSSRITFDADHIWVNWQGLGFDKATVVSLDVTGSSTVPEPSTLLLLGAGLAGVGIVRRRLKK